MARVSDRYLALVEKFIFMGGNIRHMAMDDEQKMRTMIAYEAYQVWMGNKQVKPMDLCRRISSRIYADMIGRAKHDEVYAELCAKIGIKEGRSREIHKLANDVATFDHIVGHFNAPTVNIEKAKVLDASDWLISEGMKSGNDRSVTSGSKIKMELHNNFDEKQQGFENMAKTDINITGDVSVVKPDRSNYSEEFILEYSRKYGISAREVQDLLKNDEGIYETAPTDVTPEADYYEQAEDDF